MRKMGVRALAAVLCAGLAVSVAAADDDGPATSKSSWWPGDWFAAKPKVEEKKPAAKVDAADAGPTAARREADLQARAKNAYWRRLAACDRLREIAIQTNDAALERQVEQLSQQVFEAYMQRASRAADGTRFETADGFTEGKPATKSKPAHGGEDRP
jgi:hypothetical protein